MTLEQKHKGLLFRIEEAEFFEQGKKKPIIWFYLYIYRGDRCEYDYLQDTITACKELAFEDFGAPMEDWREVT